jgi:hypothetical protein
MILPHLPVWPQNSASSCNDTSRNAGAGGGPNIEMGRLAVGVPEPISLPDALLCSPTWVAPHQLLIRASTPRIHGGGDLSLVKRATVTAVQS